MSRCEHTLSFIPFGQPKFFLSVTVFSSVFCRIKQTRNTDDRSSFFGSDRQSQTQANKRGKQYHFVPDGLSSLYQMGLSSFNQMG